MNVVPIDATTRLKLLTRDWRRAPIHEVVARCRSIAMEQRRGVHLPPDVYDAWLQMSAVVVVATGRGSGFTSLK